MRTFFRCSGFRHALTLVVLALTMVVGPALALAGPRSGGSFGGRLGFRSGGGFGSHSAPRYSGGANRYGGGTNIHIFPGFGWGWGPMGYGGFGLVGGVVTLLVVGVAIASVARAFQRSRGGQGLAGGWGQSHEDEDDHVVAMPGRAYLYKLQLALGRSARGIQDRLSDFAARGDTATEAGLASLLQQTSLELLREKDAVRYAGAEARGPMSLTNAETAMNAMALAERSRFQVERVRAADGRTVKSEAAAEEGKEALELVVVTVVAATRTPLANFKAVDSHDGLRALLSELGGVAPQGLLGIEVVWTPADPNDSMTETDVMTTYPELRSL
jgi:uncharacterized membrane protein